MFIWAILFVAAYLLMPRPKGQTLQPGQVDAQTAEVGRPIPVLFGTKLIENSNIVWYGDIKTEAVQKKSRK